uniref:U1-like Zn-finger-containing protein n=1 Tax=Philodina roseola TaxID=96448 RepID=B2L3J5_PHIRO|nr:U1-like Zn-finger-containing protein [Philodina roseola]ACC43959.1 U1-like Zn-finger-containing protein [Philodina roseola]
MPKKSRSKNKSHSGVDKKGKILKTKRKTKDLDEIQKNMAAETARELLNQPVDYDVPGAAQHYCLYCARYFVDDHNLQHHFKSKTHKRRVKELKTEAYTVEEAERAAGKGQYRPPKPVNVPGDQKNLYQMETDVV